MTLNPGDIIESPKYRWVLESRQHDSERWSAYRLQRTRYGWQGEAVNKVDVFPRIMLKNKGFRLIFKHDL